MNTVKALALHKHSVPAAHLSPTVSATHRPRPDRSRRHPSADAKPCRRPPLAPGDGRGHPAIAPGRTAAPAPIPEPNVGKRRRRAVDVTERRHRVFERRRAPTSAPERRRSATSRGRSTSPSAPLRLGGVGASVGAHGPGSSMSIASRQVSAVMNSRRPSRPPRATLLAVFGVGMKPRRLASAS